MEDGTRQPADPRGQAGPGWDGLLDRRFTLLEAPSAWTGELALELAHAALRQGPGRVLLYDASHCVHPDTFARLNRRAGLEPTAGARRTFVQRAITPFQWDTLLSKHLDRMLQGHGHEAVVLAPYDRLFATDELAEWERIDHLEFSLERLAQRAAQTPILALGDLDRLAAEQPALATRMREGVHRRVRVLRERGVWRLVHLAGARLAPPEPQISQMTQMPLGPSSAESASSAASRSSKSVHPSPATPEGPGGVGEGPMGMSQPTVSRQVDAFAAEFRLFRSNLPRSEQAWFDTLVAWTRRHGNALNVSEDLDFTRRVLLVGLLSIADHLESRLSVLEASNGITPTVPATLRPVQPAADGPGRLPVRLFPERQPQPTAGVDEAGSLDVAA
jgi:hypothetical protein